MTPIKIALLCSAAVLAVVMPASANEDYSRMSALELQGHVWSANDALTNPDTDKKLRNAYLRQMHQMKDRLAHLEQSLGDSYSDIVNERIIGNVRADLESAFQRAGEKSSLANDGAEPDEPDEPDGASEADAGKSAHASLTLTQALAEMDRGFGGDAAARQIAAAIPAEMADHARSWGSWVRAESSGLKANILRWQFEGVDEHELVWMVSYYQQGLSMLISNYSKAGQALADKLRLNKDYFNITRAMNHDHPARAGLLSSVEAQIFRKENLMFRLKREREREIQDLRRVTPQSLELAQIRQAMMMAKYNDDESTLSLYNSFNELLGGPIDEDIIRMDADVFDAFTRLYNDEGTPQDELTYGLFKYKQAARDPRLIGNRTLESDYQLFLDHISQNAHKVMRNQGLGLDVLEKRNVDASDNTTFDPNETWMDFPMDEDGASNYGVEPAVNTSRGIVPMGTIENQVSDFFQRMHHDVNKRVSMDEAESVLTKPEDGSEPDSIMDIITPEHDYFLMSPQG